MRIGIVGAGISGCYLAMLLCREGREIILFDPKGPWEKPCGGGITARSFEAFPILDAFRESCRTVHHMRMVAPTGQSSRVPFTAPVRIASRESLGSYLLDQATDAGAALVPERVGNVIPNHGGWRVFAGDQEYAFDFVVGADGAQSTLRRTLFKPFAGADVTVSVGYWMPGGFEDELVIGFLEGISGYIWIFPRVGHLSVGIGARMGEASGQALFARLDTFLAQHVPDITTRERARFGALIPSLTREGLASNCPGGSNWALIGDAAGWVDPVTGEGIYYAFRSAELLSAALREERPETYETSCRLEFVPELSKAASYVETFFDPRVSARLVALSGENAAVRVLLADLIAGAQRYGTLKQELLKTIPSLAKDRLYRLFRKD